MPIDTWAFKSSITLKCSTARSHYQHQSVCFTRRCVMPLNTHNGNASRHQQPLTSHACCLLYIKGGQGYVGLKSCHTGADPFIIQISGISRAGSNDKPSFSSKKFTKMSSTLRVRATTAPAWCFDHVVESFCATGNNNIYIFVGFIFFFILLCSFKLAIWLFFTRLHRF